MMNNNKILTVSYGTFSCTLEGFDDSFDTMKAIAEYFRDLASDDRYFGAEPPQPDAEMLARIAEREVSRRVEAREHEGRIMLKAHEQDAAVGTAAAVAAPVAPETQPEPAQDYVAEAEPKAAEEIKAEAEQVAAVPQEGTAAEEPVAAAADQEPEAPPVVEEPAEEVIAVEAELPKDIAADDTQDTEQLDEPLDSAAAFFADSVVDDGADPEPEEEISVETFASLTSHTATEASADEDLVAEDVEPQASGFSTESFAEKLERIRAVVSKQDDDVMDADFEEDNEAAMPSDSFQPLPSSIETLQNEDDAQETIAEAADDINEAFAQDDAVQASTEAFEDEADSLDAILSRIEASAEEDMEAVDVDLTAQFDDENEPAENLFEASDDTAEEEEIDVQGRVLKVNRASLEAALNAGELEEYEDESLLDAAALSGEDEDELQRDLNALDEDDQNTDTSPAAARDSLPEIDTDASEDVSRLMAQADEHMEEPEARTRRSAFAHLRAAVAARFADRSMDDEQQKVEEEAQAYRSDLAEVVKPRRPVAEPTARTERPAEPVASPLKLVAEQRIDEDNDAEISPISPRRVAVTDEEEVGLEEDSGFAQYAADRDATTLTELLEAAAAYLAFVEGHEQFSRPQLMTRVRQADCGDFSREDGLRSFGQLLRNGKIEKIKGGRFAASDAIGYKPEHRAVG
ncbi:MAG: hypothetical protein AB8B47_00815 [Roseobacter sp.]